MSDVSNVCPKCQSPLGEMETTPTGKQLQRCSKGRWNPDTKSVEGCDYVKWLQPEPEKLNEVCPKCGSALMLQTTRFGKKMKKCSAGGWDKEARKPTGCDFVEWINGTTEALDETCPRCSQPLVLYTTANGKRMKKCSTSGWDRERRVATGCEYVEWLKGDVASGVKTGGEPPHPAEMIH